MEERLFHVVCIICLQGIMGLWDFAWLVHRMVNFLTRMARIFTNFLIIRVILIIRVRFFPRPREILKNRHYLMPQSDFTLFSPCVSIRLPGK